MPALTIFPHGSSQFFALAAKHRLSVADLEQMMTRLKQVEDVEIKQALGLSTQGFFGTTLMDWDAESLDECLHFVPWVQIYELLGRIPLGSTQDYLNSDGKVH